MGFDLASTRTEVLIKSQILTFHYSNDIPRKQHCLSLHRGLGMGDGVNMSKNVQGIEFEVNVFCFIINF